MILIRCTDDEEDEFVEEIVSIGMAVLTYSFDEIETRAFLRRRLAKFLSEHE